MYPFLYRQLVPVIFSPLLGKAEGLDNIPKEGGAVLVANHASYLDHFMVGIPVSTKLNRELFFLAKKEHFKNKLHELWHKNLKAIPLDRETGGKEAMKKATEILHQGHLIMIYPEGTRTLNGKLNRGKPGAAKLALQAKVPIVPIGIHDTFEIWPKKNKMPKLGKRASCTIGKPISFEEFYGRQNEKEVLMKITTQVMNEIGKLTGQEYPFDQELLDKQV